MKSNKTDIIYEDDDYLFISKPSGLLTIPDRFDTDAPNLYHWLSDYFTKIYVVHRLDKDTSGLVGFAKTADAHRDLCIQFEKHTVEKRYLALITGKPEKETGAISLPIAEDPGHAGRMLVSRQHGKPALTDYRILESFGKYSLAEVLPKTGRTHQIRVHFKAIGHPLAIDPVYGKNDGIFLSHIKNNYKPKKNEPEKPLINRLTLHAFSLRFQHINGKIIHTEAELPKDFRSVLNHLRKFSRSS